MKEIKFLAVAAMLLTFAACNKNDDGPNYQYYRATVTFRPQSDGSYYLKEDDKTALIMKNEGWEKYPFEDGKEKRAYIEFGMDVTGQSSHKVEGYETTNDILLYGLDTLSTKNPEIFDPAKEEEYGNDMLGVYLTDDVFPTTYIEDGYLNLRFALPVGYREVTHIITLLTGVDPDDPYKVVLRHNANGDGFADTVDGLLNFPLKSLPDTKGEKVKLTLEWRSIVTGNKETATFDYCTRTDW